MVTIKQIDCELFIIFSVFRIRISFYADPEPRGVNTKEEILNVYYIFQNDIKLSLKVNKQSINLSIT